MDEFAAIKSLFAPLAEAEKGALDLKDDAAVLNVPPGKELVITKDAMVTGVHFIGDEPASLIARKLLYMNVSDLAAMGATPWGYFLALMLPETANDAWLMQFAEGLRTAGEEYGFTLMGGDTTRTPGPLALSLTALGTVDKGKALKRSGAKPGDAIYVSGTIGDAALGLQVAQGKLPPNAFLLSRYQLPTPRVKLGQLLLGLATSCIDISDGLMQDLGHICEVSGVDATVQFGDIPLSQEARAALAAHATPQDIVLAGGDDYELLFTVPRQAASQLEKVAKATNTQIACIGVVEKGDRARALDNQGAEIILTRTGYRHF